MRMQKSEPTYTRYTVNVMVTNKDTKGAPCIYESNPTYFNLLGRLEHKFQYGVATTDFSMIKAGSLHRANGGYIVIDVLDLLRNMFSYDALKRAIKNKEIRLEDIWEQYRLISTTTVRPEAIPLSIKVILVGTPYIYYLLHSLDEEYRELFKVKADFDSRMTPRTRRFINMQPLLPLRQRRTRRFRSTVRAWPGSSNTGHALPVIRKSSPHSSAR